MLKLYSYTCRIPKISLKSSIKSISNFPRPFSYNNPLFSTFIPKNFFSVQTSVEDLEAHYKKFLETDIKSNVVSNPILNSQTSATRKILKDIIISPEDLNLPSLSKKFDIPLEELEKSYMHVKDPSIKSKGSGILLEEARVLGYEFNFKLILEEKFNASITKKLPVRPPVITIMGHVDHGKTTLLDALRKSSIAQSEFGGITQKIGAFHVFTKDNKQITFIDTPGHEAFINMRIQGASCTDLIILVVSAADGVQQQTIEVVKIAQNCQVPIIVAVNKIDLKGANPEEIENELYEKAKLGIDVKGGNIPVIHISAKEKTNLELLEELLIYEASQMNLREDPNELAEGVVIEARKYDDETNSVTVLVQKGTLKINDGVIFGTEYMKIKQMKDDRGKILQKAGPSCAVEIIGLTELPSSGDVFFVLENEAQGKMVEKRRKYQLQRSQPTGEIMDGEHSLKIKFDGKKEKRKYYSGDKSFVMEKHLQAEESLNNQLKELEAQESDLSVVGFQNIAAEKNKIKDLIEKNKLYVDQFLDAESGLTEKYVKFILKGPDQGTLETLRVQLNKISKDFPNVKLKILMAGVGNINEGDFNCAKQFKCMIFGMGVAIPPEIMVKAKKEKLVIKTSKVIFGLTEEIKKTLREESNKTMGDVQSIKGVAEVGKVYEIQVSRNGDKKKVAGCIVNKGKIHKNHIYQLLRSNKKIADELKLVNLKKFKTEVSEIIQGEQCGLAFAGFDDIQPGDVIQSFELKAKAYP